MTIINSVWVHSPYSQYICKISKQKKTLHFKLSGPSGWSLIIPGFCSKKWLGVLLLPTGWVASLSQGHPPSIKLNSVGPIYTPGWREALSKGVLPKNTMLCLSGLEPWTASSRVQHTYHLAPWQRMPSLYSARICKQKNLGSKNCFTVSWTYLLTISVALLCVPLLLNLLPLHKSKLKGNMDCST